LDFGGYLWELVGEDGDECAWVVDVFDLVELDVVCCVGVVDEC